MNPVAGRLLEAGLSPSEAERKAALFAASYRTLGEPHPARGWFVPGRIEVLGKHTDYAGGRSLLCALERGMCVVARAREDKGVRVVDVVRGGSVAVSLRPDAAPLAGWENYVSTVVGRMARNFPEAAQGADIAIASDLPSAAGLSSSSVLIVAVFTALADLNRLPDGETFRSELSTPEKLAEYLGCVENGQTYGTLSGARGVGTFGGSEDHTAILSSQPGALSRYRFCPVVSEGRVRLPDGCIFAIANSGVRASKTGSARDLYNRASRAAGAVLECWRSASGRDDASLGAVLQTVPGAAEHLRAVLETCGHGDFSAEELRIRFEQFLLESEVIVPGAASAVSSGDLQRFGELVDQSQQAAEQYLGNQVPETIALARSARELGAIAASAFGAGFGGSVWALVRAGQADEFLASWRSRYSTDFGNSRSEFFLTAAGPALTGIDL